MLAMAGFYGLAMGRDAANEERLESMLPGVGQLKNA